MGMYVYWYGFSYEKFFASYTTIFALLVFAYLLIASFSTKRKDVFKFIAFAALWSYGVATVTPVERIIFNSNVKLSQLADSRVELYELQQLSLDVVGDAKRLMANNIATSKLTSNQLNQWGKWVERQQTRNCDRDWYERNWSLISACQ